MPTEHSKVINYYDRTRLEYRVLWRYKQGLSLHFGYYERPGQSHDEAVIMLNEKFLRLLSSKVTTEFWMLAAG